MDVAPRRRSEFDAFCRDALDFLDDAGVRYLLIGGLAVIAVGEPRTTGDIDVVAFLSRDAAERLIFAWGQKYPAIFHTRK